MRFQVNPPEVTLKFWLKRIVKWDLRLNELKAKTRVVVKKGLYIDISG